MDIHKGEIFVNMGISNTHPDITAMLVKIITMPIILTNMGNLIVKLVGQLLSAMLKIL